MSGEDQNTTSHSPDDWPTSALPDGFMAELGRTVATFGWLEDNLKRAIFALTATRPQERITDGMLRDWIRQMNDIADDSLSTLIDQFDAQMRGNPAAGADPQLIKDLRAQKDFRNLICHSAWTEAGDGRFRPDFIDNRGDKYDGTLGVEDFIRMRAEVAKSGESVIAIIAATGVSLPGRTGRSLSSN
ncbi:hypothetical protein [Paracoccus pacificus]|uniref:Uncharacterized protein n=1 Tax=Paracoccus pacificus TaxID=1463598 RepID=A0ABW4R4X7_9RHOB